MKQLTDSQVSALGALTQSPSWAVVEEVLHTLIENLDSCEMAVEGKAKDVELEVEVLGRARAKQLIETFLVQTGFFKSTRKRVSNEYK